MTSAWRWRTAACTEIGGGQPYGGVRGPPHGLGECENGSGRCDATLPQTRRLLSAVSRKRAERGQRWTNAAPHPAAVNHDQCMNNMQTRHATPLHTVSCQHKHKHKPRAHTERVVANGITAMTTLVTGKSFTREHRQAGSAARPPTRPPPPAPPKKENGRQRENSRHYEPTRGAAAPSAPSPASPPASPPTALSAAALRSARSSSSAARNGLSSSLLSVTTAFFQSRSR